MTASEPDLATTTAILGDLIGFPTVSADSNLEMIAYLATRLEEAGARAEVMLDRTGGKANLFASFGPEAEGGIVLSGHSDVVPVTDQAWSGDPFAMWAEDDRLFGRGACDMKGFIAAVLAMAPRLAASVTDRPLHVAITHDEEVGCLGARDLVAALASRDLRPSLAIIGEPTSMRVIEGHKGCHEYTTRFRGLEGHGSDPEAGVNAVEYAVRYVGRLLDLREAMKDRAPAESRFQPPWTTINLGGLHGGAAHNVIAGKAEVEWEMRPVRPEDGAHIHDELRRYCEDVLLPAMRAVHPGASIETEIIGEVEGLIPTERNAARDLVAALTGANAADVVPFGTEGGMFQALGMDVVICGPGSIAQAHKADEYVEMGQMEQCLSMLGGLARRLSGQV